MPQETLTWASEVIDDTGNGTSRLQAQDANVLLFQTIGHDCIIELTNLTGDIGTINYIQHTAVASGIAGKTFADLKVNLLDGSNSQYYSETHTLNPPGLQTVTGTQRTTSDGSTAWTESDINALRLQLVFAAESGPNDLQVDFVSVLVDYNAPVTGAPIKLDSGLVKLTSGLIRIS
mgnify:FL=1